MANKFSSVNRTNISLKARKASMFLPLKSIGDESGISTSTSATSSPNSFVSNKSVYSLNGRTNLISNVPSFKPSAHVANLVYTPVSPISPLSSIDCEYGFDLASTPAKEGKSIWSPNQTLVSVNQPLSNSYLSESKSYSNSRRYSSSSYSGSSASDCPVCTSCCSLSDDSNLSDCDRNSSSDEFEALLDKAEKILYQYLQNSSMTVCKC